MKTKTLLAAVALLLSVGFASAQQKDSTTCCKPKTCVCVDKDGNKTCKKDDKGACVSDKCKCAKECNKECTKSCTKDSTACKKECSKGTKNKKK